MKVTLTWRFLNVILVHSSTTFFIQWSSMDFRWSNLGPSLRRRHGQTDGRLIPEWRVAAKEDDTEWTT